MIIVGLTGGTCAGKTRLANQLMASLCSQNIAVSYLAQDWYYRDLSDLPFTQQGMINLDCPKAIDTELFDSDLYTLKHGESISAPIYDASRNIRLRERRIVTPANILLVDGLFLLMNSERRSLFDIAVYLVVPDDVRLVRRIRRDVFDRGLQLQEILAYWEQVIRPMHDVHVASATEHAHLLMRHQNDQDTTEAVATLWRHLNSQDAVECGVS